MDAVPKVTKSRQLDNQLIESKISTSTSKPRHTTQPTYTATTKEVKTSVSSKVTVSRQRYHARYKETNNNKTKLTKNSENTTVKNSTNALRDLNRGTKPKFPPKVTSSFYNKKSVRNATAPEVESTTAVSRKTYTTRGGITEQIVSASEVRNYCR